MFFRIAAYTEARAIQAAYWVGGFQDKSTTLSITDKTEAIYAKGMIQFNTTTQQFTALEAPFAPVQEGALLYLPVGEMGILVFIGGDTPSVQDGSDIELTAVSASCKNKANAKRLFALNADLSDIFLWQEFLG